MTKSIEKSVGRIPIHLLLAGMLLFLLAGSALAAKPVPPSPTDGTLTGKVLDASTADALVGATVTAAGAPGSFAATTNSKGAYTLVLPPGDYTATASAAGYEDDIRAVTSVAGVVTSVSFSLAPPPQLPHSSRVSTYSGPQTCLNCHGSYLADEVFGSGHFQIRSLTPNLDMPGGGSHGMLDRACGLPGTTLMANNFAGVAVSPIDGSTKNDGCGSCHIAYRPPQFYPSADAALPDIDCLICHAEVYGGEWSHEENIALYGENAAAQPRTVITLSDGSLSWSQDRTLKTAQSVGNPITTEACLRCHEHGMSGYKRATPFTLEDDVHVSHALDCTTCHVTSQHKIARGNYVTDGGMTDLPSVEVGCNMSGCHAAAPHNANYADDLNRHATNVTCEACHIHQMDEPQNIHRRAWAPFCLNPLTGEWEATPQSTAAEYPGFWDAYTEYYPLGSRPELRWFNGMASMLAQPYGGYDDRRSAGGDARLFSFKPFVNGMLFDAGWLPGPSSDPTFDQTSGTWPFSMKFFYEQNWDKFLAFGFADASYTTPADYWTARPDMAMMLNNFPMMLQFDRAIYLSEAGTVIGNPSPGPQSAATYPGIAKAVNSGLGKMAIDMGYFPAESDPLAVGPYMWSGSFFGMWVPVNMDPEAPFFGEIGSFITMSHAIKSNRSYTGDACYACHFTADEYNGVSNSGNKYLSYAMLGYPDLDGNGLVDPMYDREIPLVENCFDMVDNDGDGLIDCLDTDCVDDCGAPVSEICNDGIDNDGDALADCADSDCLGLYGCGPEGKDITCSDGIDNDADGLIDCADPGCAKNRSCR